jgi:hypothetical protein
LERLGDGSELAQGGFQVFHDLAGNHVRREQAIGVIEAWVPECPFTGFLSDTPTLPGV